MTEEMKKDLHWGIALSVMVVSVILTICMVVVSQVAILSPVGEVIAYTSTALAVLSICYVVVVLDVLGAA